MTSCSTREFGPGFFMAIGMSCIRFLASFLRFLLRMDADCSHGTADNIERLTAFPRQQSNTIEKIVRAWPDHRRAAIAAPPSSQFPAAACSHHQWEFAVEDTEPAGSTVAVLPSIQVKLWSARCDRSIHLGFSAFILYLSIGARSAECHWSFRLISGLR